MLQKINPVLRHGINSESELKEAEQSQKESKGDDVNGEVRVQEEESQNSNNNVDTDIKASADNVKDNAETCATDSPSAKNISEPSVTQSGNDNNSNNREIVEEPVSNNSVLKNDENKSESTPEMSKSEKVVVTEQTESAQEEKSNLETASFVNIRDQSLSVETDKGEKQSALLLASDASGVEQVDKPTTTENQNSMHGGDVAAENVMKCEEGEGAPGVARTNTDEASQKQNIPSESDINVSGGTTGDSTSKQVEGDQQPKLEPKSVEGTESNEQEENEQNNKGNGPHLQTSVLSPPRPANVPICWSPPRPTTPLPDREEILPPLGEFELVCDSVDGLRALVKKFSGEPEEIVIPAKGKKKKKV